MDQSPPPIIEWTCQNSGWSMGILTFPGYSDINAILVPLPFNL